MDEVNIVPSINLFLLTFSFHLPHTLHVCTYPSIESKGVVGVVSAGGCRMGKSVASLAQGVKVPVLLLEVMDPCHYDLVLPATVPVLPLYDASVSVCVCVCVCNNNNKRFNFNLLYSCSRLG